MNAKLQNTHGTWVNPDDAPELTDEFFENATRMIGDRVASREEFSIAVKAAMGRGRPRVVVPKVSTTIRFDQDVLDALRASGKGWQTRVNDAMRDWLKSHSVV